MHGNSSDVGIAKNRGSGFTAISTIEAVDGLKNFMMTFVKPGIQLFVFSVFL
jgi:hypothetical protein